MSGMETDMMAVSANPEPLLCTLQNGVSIGLAKGAGSFLPGSDSGKLCDSG